MKVKVLLKKEDVLSRFKTQEKAGNAIGVTKVAVGLWGYYVPQAAAWVFIDLFPDLPHEIKREEAA